MERTACRFKRPAWPERDLLTWFIITWEAQASLLLPAGILTIKLDLERNCSFTARARGGRPSTNLTRGRHKGRRGAVTLHELEGVGGRLKGR